MVTRVAATRVAATRVAATRVAATLVAATRVAATRVAATRVAATLVAATRVAATRVAATLVTPGFALTCGMVDVACFGVLLPLIKDFFWIAIVISSMLQIFWISLPPQLLGIVDSTGDAKVFDPSLSGDQHAESITYEKHRRLRPEAGNPLRLIINLRLVNY
jgi:hypothetical protein